MTGHGVWWMVDGGRRVVDGGWWMVDGVSKWGKGDKKRKKKGNLAQWSLGKTTFVC